MDFVNEKVETPNVKFVKKVPQIDPEIQTIKHKRTSYALKRFFLGRDCSILPKRDRSSFLNLQRT